MARLVPGMPYCVILCSPFQLDRRAAYSPPAVPVHQNISAISHQHLRLQHTSLHTPGMPPKAPVKRTAASSSTTAPRKAPRAGPSTTTATAKRPATTSSTVAKGKAPARPSASTQVDVKPKIEDTRGEEEWADLMKQQYGDKKGADWYSKGVKTVEASILPE